jgi:hypothetical protein
LQLDQARMKRIPNLEAAIAILTPKSREIINDLVQRFKFTRNDYPPGQYGRPAARPPCPTFPTTTGELDAGPHLKAGGVQDPLFPGQAQGAALAPGQWGRTREGFT